MIEHFFVVGIKSKAMKLSHFNKVLLNFQKTTLAILTGLFLLQVFNSLEWRMEHDTPLLHYTGFLIKTFDLVPYKDIFETSMPGTFAFHYLVGALFGYGDFAFRLVDLLLLGALLAVTYMFMRRFGRFPALWAVVLFGLIYLGEGQTMSLQRDYIGIIPIAFALLTIPARAHTAVSLYRFALVGLLFGLSVLIKPHLAIALPLIFGTLISFRWSVGSKSWLDFLLCGVVCVVSFCVPVLISVIWLAANSALQDFSDILFHYLPMHSAMAGSHHALAGQSRIAYLLLNSVKMGGYGILALVALFAYYRILRYVDTGKANAISVICLALCTIAYAVYPTIAGKFWNYHYMPFAYFCSLSVSLCLYTSSEPLPSNSSPKFRAALPFVIFLSALLLQINFPRYVARSFSEFQSGPEVHAPKGGRVDEIADWLKSRLHPGDTVQSLDWTGGAIHAMLIVKAELATRFMYDYHFYHHVSSAYTRQLRENFIKQLRNSSPRFIVEITTSKPWISGTDTIREFPELRMFIGGHYKVAFKGDGYLIYEHRSQKATLNILKYQI